ncbi:MAG: MBL fold metallo-hydrolase [Deltaproteobacteria bacterium]|nr:MAG: MBL fold metallo-hydrolase [Deltaproteobacteria bacterium]
MLVFDQLETGPIQTNTYIVGCSNTREAAVIDPGGHVGAILSALDRHGLECKVIINTHAHFDHVGGNRELKNRTGAELCIHPEEAPMLAGLRQQALLFGMLAEESPEPDRLVKEGDTVQVGELVLDVLHTPGHSPGSISLVIRDNGRILVGDLVFRGSVGRTDLPGGSMETLVRSVKEKIFTYPDDTVLLPGHGPATSVGLERRTNPFLSEMVL